MARALQVPGPWTDLAEGVHAQLRRRGLHTHALASPLTFARLCAYLRKLPPLATAGGTLLLWRLTAEELELAISGPPAELLAARVLSPGVRRLQKAALAAVLERLGFELVDDLLEPAALPSAAGGGRSR